MTIDFFKKKAAPAEEATESQRNFLLKAYQDLLKIATTTKSQHKLKAYQDLLEIATITKSQHKIVLGNNARKGKKFEDIAELLQAIAQDSDPDYISVDVGEKNTAVFITFHKKK